MTMNESYSEYLRQIEVIRANNLRQQKQTNKYVLIFAGIMVIFITTMLILNACNIVNLAS